jgi:hypothetical protein
MKKQFIFIVSLFIATLSHTQNYSLNSSQVIKNPKGSAYMNLLCSDEKSIYALKVTNKVRGIGRDNGYDTYYSFCKYDNGLNQVFETDLNKLIGNKIFECLVPLQKSIYFFISDYQKKTFILYGVELDRTTGNKVGDFKEIYSYKKEDKWDEMDFTIRVNSDSSGFIVTGQNSNSEKFDDAYYISLVDKNLNNTGFTKINPPIDHKMQMFAMENIISVNNNTFFLFGRLIQAIEVKKNQLKWDYKNHVVYRFDNKGNKLAEYAIDLHDKNIENCKLMMPPGTSDIYLAGLYSNKTESGKINGAFISKLSNDNLRISQTSIKEMSPAYSYVGYGHILFREPIYDLKRKRVFMVAEPYNEQIDRGRLTTDKTTFSSHDISFQHDFRELNTYTYDYGDFFIMHFDLSTTAVKNLSLLKKKQTEKIAECPYNSYPTMIAAFPIGKPERYNYYAGVAPFYSSTCVDLVQDKLLLMYNEQDPAVKKDEETKETKHLGFNRSVLTCFSFDVNSGAFTKKEITTCTDQPIFMPRLGLATGSNMFLPAMVLTRRLESELKLTKVVVTN